MTFNETEKEVCEGWIEDIKSDGKLLIMFNDDMKTGFNLTKINHQALDIYIVPALARHLDENDFNITSLNFTWKVTNFEEDTLEI